MLSAARAQRGSGWAAALAVCSMELLMALTLAATIRAAPRHPSDPVLGPLAAAAHAHAPNLVDACGCAPHDAASSWRSAFVSSDGLLYRLPRSDRICVPATGALRSQVLQELHATLLSG